MTEALRLEAPVSPGGTIGILGGGQLGRMLSLAAARLGLKTHIYSDEEDAPAFQVCSQSTHASYDDKTALEAFSRACNAVTFEFENIPKETLEFVSRFSPANPGAAALNITQDRHLEKAFVKKLGLAVPKYVPVNQEDPARAAVELLSRPRTVLKTRRFGYDGKGQILVTSVSEAVEAFRAFKGAPAILEEFVEFAFEASVVAARGPNGAFAAYDPPENVHGNHILRRSTVPGRLTRDQTSEAIAIARTIADELDYVGVLAVELFVASDGRLLVNEIAPRVHNSGHWTIEACVVNQFEQHVRAIAGWPLGDPSRHADAVMENIIGEEAHHWQEFAGKRAGLHLYGKQEMRPGRKMGHVTTLSPLSSR